MANSGAKKRKIQNDKEMLKLRVILLVSNLLYIVYRMVIHKDSFGGWNWFSFITMALLNLLAYKLISASAAPTFSAEGELIDGGNDLSAGLNEYYFDIVYICVITQVIGLFTDKALLLLLTIPGFAFYKLWDMVIKPWIFTPDSTPQVEDEKTKKKREKDERKAKKIKYIR
ncbi:transmembrane protein [Tieghemostelium lacteum]|uniref:Transmembrane protein n=1 Tax=Tieghemostelium lacteum TaxID=361077 RepID=A0A151ZRX8_TIELA|nr:transmembrane protein [Tieghemostelium lacteum]|eukprot:KYQ96688.1 transmembrane protein [Tieghemostelium lacteum]